MVSDHKSVELAQAVLGSHGLSVQRLAPASEVKTSDLRAVDSDGNSYLVEVKSRHDDVGIQDARERSFDAGELFSYEKTLGFDNTVSSKLHQASQQLESDSRDSFRLVFYDCLGRFPDFQCEQIITSLYGCASLFSTDAPNGMLTCYYFGHSIFYRLRHSVDAAFVSWRANGEQRILLCVNDCSPRHPDLLNSTLLKKVPSQGVKDPFLDEATGVAIVLRASVNRSDESEVLSHLRSLLGWRSLNVIRPTLRTAEMLVPKAP